MRGGRGSGSAWAHGWWTGAWRTRRSCGCGPGGCLRGQHRAPVQAPPLAERGVVQHAVRDCEQRASRDWGGDRQRVSLPGRVAAGSSCSTSVQQSQRDVRVLHRRAVRPQRAAGVRAACQVAWKRPHTARQQRRHNQAACHRHQKRYRPRRKRGRSYARSVLVRRRRVLNLWPTDGLDLLSRDERAGRLARSLLSALSEHTSRHLRRSRASLLSAAHRGHAAMLDECVPCGPVSQDVPGASSACKQLSARCAARLARSASRRARGRRLKLGGAVAGRCGRVRRPASL